MPAAPATGYGEPPAGAPAPPATAAPNQRGRVSNPDSPSPYRRGPRRGGRFDGEPDGYRGRFSPRTGPGGGGSARPRRPGYPGRGAGGYGGSGARTADPGDGGWGWNGADEPADDDGGRYGNFWRNGDTDGWSLRGRGSRASREDRGGRSEGREDRGGRGEGRLSGRRDSRDWRDEDGDWAGRVGRGVTSARDRYAAARERYAARRAGGRADGYRAAAYQGAAFRGPGDAGATGYDIRRRLARPGERLPGQRRLPGQGGRGGRGGGRRKGDWWRRWTWKKAASVAGAVAAAFALAGAGGVWVAYAQTPIPDPQAAATQAASTVYFSNGKTLVGQFGTYDRQTLTLAQIPKVLQNAVVAAEDKNFYHEGGISPTGILRAAYYDLTSSGGNLQGGSTITQQLVRNFYTDIGTAQTMSRKIKEIFVAEKLARARSKQWILQEYLNTVYFGQGAYGVGAAASVYFGYTPATLHKITAAQAAMIAAMIQSPSYYKPDPKGGVAHQALVSRWQYVLGAMVKMGALSQQDASKALAKFPTVVKPVNNSWSGYNGYIMQAVMYELQNTYHYSKQQIFNGGLRITTTFSQRLMKSLYATVRANRTLMRNATPPSPPYNTPHVACTPHGCLPKYVHIGALLEDPATGAILAMYSGKNYNQNQYDDALESRNQVGSSFKPYVLATAVSQGMNVMTSKLNGFAPLWIPPDSQPMTFASVKNQSGVGWYQVRNDEVVNPNRPVSVVEATAMSLNTAYADLWHRVALNPSSGAHNVVDMAKAFGVDPAASGLTTMRDEAGTALGQASLTVEEQANTIATMADNGVYHAPHVIKEIQDNGALIHARVATHMVLNPAQAAEVDYAMSFDDGPMGTAYGLGLSNGQKIIAKTGTTNLSQSAFFMGATPRYAMAVGMFVSDPRCPRHDQAICSSASALAFAPPSDLQTLFGVGGLSGYGGQWPAIIWHDFFMKNFNGLSVQPWPALPANFGSAWNLVDPKMIIKPRPHPKPSFSPPCFGNGRKCRPSPGPSPSFGCPPVCPTVTPSLPPTGPPTAGTVSGATASGLVVGGLVAGGLATGGLAAGWLPGRRRRGGGRARNRGS